MSVASSITVWSSPWVVIGTGPLVIPRTLLVPNCYGVLVVCRNS